MRDMDHAPLIYAIAVSLASEEVDRGPAVTALVDVAERSTDALHGALDRAVDRTGAAGLRELSRTLSRAQRAGVSTRASLRAVADDFRAERRARADELARRAPVKMLFPLVLLILPAFLLLTVGPVLLSTIRSLH